jgi:hypothetical protein
VKVAECFLDSGRPPIVASAAAGGILTSKPHGPVLADFGSGQKTAYNAPMSRRFQFSLQNMKILLLTSVIFVAVTGCDNRSSRTTSEAEWEAEYRKRVDAQMEESGRQIRRVTTQQDVQAEQNERFDKLLDRWEKQAKRQEAILDAQEKQLGIKN